MLYEQPSIYIFSVRIDEPVTTVTDLFVSAVCFYAFYKLASTPVRNKVQANLRIYFLSMGIATLLGGLIGHAFLYNFSYHWKLPAWITSMISIAFVERASIEYARPLITRRLGTIFKWANTIELITFIAITLSTLNFFFVEVHSAYGLLFVVTSLNLYIYRKRKAKGSRLFLIAVGFSAISALIFMNEWGVSRWFTHTDISHIFMTISAGFFYLGARHIISDSLLNDPGKSGKPAKT
jgi:hypothetical protein